MAIQGSAPELAEARASERVAEARYQAGRAGMFPVFEATTTGQNITRNLNAEGFRFDTNVPGLTIPKSVGPFNTFDARMSLTQTVVNFSALRRAGAGQAAVSAAQADTERMRDNLARQAAQAYAAMLRESASVTASEAALAQARATLASARNRQTAGTGIAMDVTRAEYQALRQQQELSASRGGLDRAALALASVLGLDFGARIELEDDLHTPIPDPLAVGEAVASALRARGDLESVRQRERQLRMTVEAVELERLPTVAAYADAGALGGIETHTVALSVRIPVFDSGRRKSRAAEASAMLQQEQARESQLRRSIELQIRQADINMRIAAEQVTTSESYVALAEAELAQARRRHEAGVTGLPDVIEAQGRLASAVRARVESLFRYTEARIEAAYASGSIRSFSL
jgi:outer membrane protein TolC